MSSREKKQNKTIDKLTDARPEKKLRLSDNELIDIQNYLTRIKIPRDVSQRVQYGSKLLSLRENILSKLQAQGEELEAEIQQAGLEEERSAFSKMRNVLLGNRIHKKEMNLAQVKASLEASRRILHRLLTETKDDLSNDFDNYPDKDEAAQLLTKLITYSFQDLEGYEDVGSLISDVRDLQKHSPEILKIEGFKELALSIFAHLMKDQAETEELTLVLEAFGLSHDDLDSPQVRAALLEVVEKTIGRSYWQKDKTEKDFSFYESILPFFKDAINSQPVLELVGQRAYELLETAEISYIRYLLKLFNISPSSLDKEKLISISSKSMTNWVRDASAYDLSNAFVPRFLIECGLEIKDLITQEFKDELRARIVKIMTEVNPRYLDEIKNLLKLFDLPLTFLRHPEIRQAGIEGLKLLLEGSLVKIDDIKDLQSTFGLTKKDVQTDELKQAAVKAIYKIISDGHYYSVDDLTAFFGLTEKDIDEDEFQQEMRGALISILSTGKTYESSNVMRVAKDLFVDREVLQDPEIQKLVKNFIQTLLSSDNSYDINSTIRISDLFEIPLSFFNDKEVLGQVRSKVIIELNSEYPDVKKVIDLAEFIEIDLDRLLTPEIEKALVRVCLLDASRGHKHHAKAIIDYFGMDKKKIFSSPEAILQMITGWRAEAQRDRVWNLDHMKDFADFYLLGKEFFSDPQIQNISVTIISRWLADSDQYKHFDADGLIRLIKRVHLSADSLADAELMAAVKRKIGKILSDADYGFIKKVDQLLSFFKLRTKLDSYLVTKAKGAFNELIKKGDFAGAFELSELFSGLDEALAELESHFPVGMDVVKIKEVMAIPQVGKEIVQSLSGLEILSFTQDVEPVLASQGDAAFLFFKAVKKIPNYRELSQKEIAFIVHLSKKYNTQARNIVENILQRVDSIQDNIDSISTYLEVIPIVHFDAYSEFLSLHEQGKAEEIEQLRQQIFVLSKGVYAGTLSEEDFSEELYPAVSYGVFPPAVGLTQGQYDQLNKERSDRRNDVPAELDSLQRLPLEVGTGKFILGEGEELNLEIWQRLSGVIHKVNQEVEESELRGINEVEVMDRFLEIRSSNSAANPSEQEYIFETMYRYHLLSGNGPIEADFGLSLSELVRLKEFVGDRIKNDLIRDCFMVWKKARPEKYQEIKQELFNKEEDSAIGRILGTLRSVKRKTGEDQVKAIEVFDDFLQDFGLNYEMVKDKTRDEIVALVNQVHGARDSSEFVERKVSSDLIGVINKQMRKEVEKFSFDSESGAAETIELELMISKKKEHGVAGYNMGVCVAPDAKLWNDQGFWNVLLMNPESFQAMGGMHFLIREGSLCLPGINPSIELLAQVDNEELYQKMIEYAISVKETLGLNQVLIPVQTSIHSNRSQLQGIIRSRNYEIIKLKEEASFSYNPAQYSFQECFVVG